MSSGVGAVPLRSRRFGSRSRFVFLVRLLRCLSSVVLVARRRVFFAVFVVLSGGGVLCGVSVPVVCLCLRLSLLARGFLVSACVGWRVVLFGSALRLVLRSVLCLGVVLGGFRCVVARLMFNACGAHMGFASHCSRPQRKRAKYR